MRRLLICGHLQFPGPIDLGKICRYPDPKFQFESKHWDNREIKDERGSHPGTSMFRKVSLISINRLSLGVNIFPLCFSTILNTSVQIGSCQRPSLPLSTPSHSMSYFVTVPPRQRGVVGRVLEEQFPPALYRDQKLRSNFVSYCGLQAKEEQHYRPALLDGERYQKMPTSRGMFGSLLTPAA